MSELNDLTLLQVQKKLKPKIEDVIPLIVDGDYQQNALNLVTWFRANKMAPGWSGVHNAWDAKCKGKTICKISLDMDGTWRTRLYLNNNNMYEDRITHKELQEVLISGLIYCTSCIPDGECRENAMKENRQFFGKEYKGLCYGCTWTGGLMLLFTNPDEAAINNMKVLFEMEKEARTKI